MMKSFRNHPMRKHLELAGRYVIAAVAGLLFAYVAWSPQSPSGSEDPVAQPFVLPPSMLDAVREQGLMAADETTIPPPEAVAAAEPVE